MYLFVPCDKKSHGTEISFPIRSKRLSHPHPLLCGLLQTEVLKLENEACKIYLCRLILW